MLGIVGSRNFKDYISFKSGILKVLKEWNIKTENVEGIVSGGALGTDKMAEQFADEFGIKKYIFPVTKGAYKLYGRAAPLKRNEDIINLSTHLIAFPSKSGSGTQHSISLANKKGILMKVLFID